MSTSVYIVIHGDFILVGERIKKHFRIFFDIFGHFLNIYIYIYILQRDHFSKTRIFTTKEIKISTTDNRELNLLVSKICPGRTMCAVNELKLIITLETQFSFLEAKDFYIKTDNINADNTASN